MTAFQLIHGLAIGDIDRATLNAMYFLQDPHDEDAVPEAIAEMTDEALAVSIICEEASDKTLAKLFDAACEINHEDRFCK